MSHIQHIGGWSRQVRLGGLSTTWDCTPGPGQACLLSPELESFQHDKIQDKPNLGISFPGVFGCFKTNHGQVMKSELLFQWSHVSDFYSLLEGE